MKIIEIKRWNYFIRCQACYYSNTMAQLLDNLEHELSKASVFLKKGTSSTVIKLVLDGKVLVIKRANMRGRYHALRRLFQPSRAKKNWDYAQRLQSAGISTFEPIAMVEKRWGPFRRESFFICNFLEGKDLNQAFVTEALSFHEQEEMAIKIVEMIKTLAKEGLYHRDLNLTNIILVDKKPHIIDLDSMQRYKKSFITEFLLKLKLWHRLMKNIEDEIGKSASMVALFRQTFRRNSHVKLS